MNVINRIGKAYGRLTVLEYSHTNKHYDKYWKTKCNCGNIKTVLATSLVSGNVRSCGCLRKEISSRNTGVIKHGLTYKRMYKSWHNMIDRCTNKKHPKFKYWGGRGIKVCDRWFKIENFFDDMGERPKGLTLERINNDGNYEPNNCKWATYKEQNNNKRKL